ncbi:MAG: SPW repeat protein [Candidatus Limnocylindria bacterium]
MWTHLLPVLAGIWLMASPAVLAYADPARANDRIVGPIVASMATIAIWEIARPLRWVNVILGAWLLIAPWLLGHPPGARWNSLAAGALVLAMSLMKGTRTHKVGGGWSSLWKGAPPDGRSRTG